MNKANPQLENGYTAIANEIMEALAKIRIPGVERQCLDFILRKTYGFNKKKDLIALSQFAKGTGLKKPHIIRALNGLLSKKIIRVTNNDNKIAQEYEFNKHYKQWKALPKKITLPIKITGVTNNGNRSLSLLGTTKVDSTKATLTKEAQKSLPYNKIIPEPILSTIVSTCLEIDKLHITKPKSNGIRRFEPHKWIQKVTNKQANFQAIELTLKRLVQYWDTTNNPNAYIEKIFKIENQNLNEAAGMDEHETRKNAPVPNELKSLTEEIGG